MKVIFMGTPDFAVTALEAIIAAGHQVVLVVSQPDKPKGRGKSVQFPPVKEFAVEHDIPVYQPVRIRQPECVQFLRTFSPDIIIVAAFGQILPKEILDLPPYGCVNIHASLLPKYRGAAPIQWAVINGEAVTGVTTQKMAEGLDTGDMILKRELTLDPKETGGSLFDKLQKLGAELCVDTMKAIAEGTATYEPQKEEEATHVGMISKQMGFINWGLSAVEIERLIRGLNPWPSAYTSLHGKTLKIWAAEVLPDEKKPSVRPGQILGRTKQSLLVQTGNGILSLAEVQLEGKKRMDTEAFLRGYQVDDGEMLGDLQ